MKEVRYEFIVKMVTIDRVYDFDAEFLAKYAAENMKQFVKECGADLGLDDISMLEGRLYIDGTECCHVGCGVTVDTSSVCSLGSHLPLEGKALREESRYEV